MVNPFANMTLEEAQASPFWEALTVSKIEGSGKFPRFDLNLNMQITLSLLATREMDVEALQERFTKMYIERMQQIAMVAAHKFKVTQ